MAFFCQFFMKQPRKWQKIGLSACWQFYCIPAWACKNTSPWCVSDYFLSFSVKTRVFCFSSRNCLHYADKEKTYCFGLESWLQIQTPAS